MGYHTGPGPIAFATFATFLHLSAWQQMLCITVTTCVYSGMRIGLLLFGVLEFRNET